MHGAELGAFVLRAFAEADAAGALLASVVVPVAPSPLQAATLGGDAGPVVRWEDPTPDTDGRVWSFGSSGEAARVEGDGDARFDQVRRQAADVFASLATRVHADARFAPEPRLFGGVAFRPEAVRTEPWTAFRDASFTLPRWLYGTCGERAFLRISRRAGEPVDAARLASLLDTRTPRASPPGEHHTGRVDLTRQSADAWGAMIGDALACIRAHELEKVVPMTLCRIATTEALDAMSALDRLRELYPECVRFAFQRGDGIFLGASPERLVHKRGLYVWSDALAGSAPRRADGDARAAAALLESDKDRREHAVVVDAVRGALAPLSSRITVPSAPVVRTLRNVHHLWTPISATLAQPAHVLDLVRLLHPTPAVCGTPREAAIRWIAAHEPEQRGWYAGAVGWFDAAGDGAFSVAIRSGVLARREAWLYAGAGIVEGSDASLEFAETRMKQMPMLTALGLVS